MALDEPKDEDHVEDFGDFRVLVEKDLADNFPEIKMDFVDTPQGKGFSVSTGDSGGCGSGCSGC